MSPEERVDDLIGDLPYNIGAAIKHLHDAALVANDPIPELREAARLATREADRREADLAAPAPADTLRPPGPEELRAEDAKASPTEAFHRPVGEQEWKLVFAGTNFAHFTNGPVRHITGDGWDTPGWPNHARPPRLTAMHRGTLYQVVFDCPRLRLGGRHLPAEAVLAAKAPWLTTELDDPHHPIELYTGDTPAQLHDAITTLGGTMAETPILAP